MAPKRKRPDAAAPDIGLNASAFDRIKLAPGVIGKTASVAAASIVSLGIVAFSLREPLYLLAVGGMITLIVLTFVIGALIFANKHPGLSLLEGAELIQWRELEMGQKGRGTISHEPSVEAPQLLGHQEGRQ